MNEFKQIAEELKIIRKANPRKPVPLSLRERILGALEATTMSRDDAANILGIHPMTFYKWQRKMARSEKKRLTPKKAVGRPKNYHRLIILLLKYLDQFNYHPYLTSVRDFKPIKSPFCSC